MGAIPRKQTDLGITFYREINFKKHIANITKKANQMLGIIKRNFSFINRDIFIKLYRSLVRPHLEYGQCIWSPYLIHCKKEIEKVQRRATKIVPGMNNLSYEERLIKLKLSSLNYRRMRGDLIQKYSNYLNQRIFIYFLSVVIMQQEAIILKLKRNITELK